MHYGFRRIPQADKAVYGGLVKVQHMQDAFPNTPRRFNILYMVSSRMPLGAASIAWASKRKGARLIWNQNGVAYPAWHGSGWKMTNAPMAALLHAADHVFYQSYFCKLSADRYLGERDGRWEILYNAVDTTIFTPTACDPDPHRLILLLAGNQYQYYRLESALLCLAAVVRGGLNAYLVVTGQLCWIADQVSAVRSARQLVSRLGLDKRVHFLGPYAQASAPTIYRQCHILLHTKYNDPCPAVVVEAMACGLPVVYSESGGVPELVGQEAGVGVPAKLDWEHDVPPASETMARAVIKVAASRHAYASAARRRAVERFDLKPWLARHREVFESVLQ